GICAAFGGVCLAMYFWQTEMLALLLAPQFYPFVLLSGVGLLALVVVRSVALWRQMGARAQAGHAHHHDHEHHHHHDHDHEHCGHDHDPGHGGHDHANHAHDHDHGHAHAHDHDHGHDHSWAPWRYVVLLIPIMLFLLGLPSRGLNVQAAQLDTTHDVAG